MIFKVGDFFLREKQMLKLLRDIYEPTEGQSQNTLCSNARYQRTNSSLPVLPGLSTVEGAIVLFSGSKWDLRVQFMHFRPMVSFCSRDFDPYAMSAQPSGTTATATLPLATFSPLGVTIAQTDGTSDVLTLREYVLESGRFRFLRGNLFFKHFLERKIITDLQRKVLERRFNRARDRVKSFSLARYVGTAGRELSDMRNVSLVCSIQGPRTLAEFTSDHTRAIDAGLGIVRDRIRTIVAHLETTLGVHTPSHTSSAKKSNLKPEIPHGRVYSFLQLCDQMILGALSETASRFVSSMLELLQGTAPVLSVSLRSDGAVIRLDPDLKHILDFVTDATSRVMASLGSFSGVISAHLPFSWVQFPGPRPDFYELVQDQQAQLILRATNIFATDVDRIPSGILHTVAKIAQLRAVGPGEINSDLDKLKAIENSSDLTRKLPESFQAGILLIDTYQLKESHSVELSAVRREVVQRLLDGSRESSANLNVTLVEATKALHDAAPRDLDGYVKLLAQLHDAEHILSSDPDKSVLTRVRDALTTNGVRVPNDDLIHWQMIDGAVGSLTDACVAARLVASEKRSWAENALSNKKKWLINTTEALVESLGTLSLEAEEVEESLKVLECRLTPELEILKSGEADLKRFAAIMESSFPLNWHGVDDCDKLLTTFRASALRSRNLLRAIQDVRKTNVESLDTSALTAALTADSDQDDSPFLTLRAAWLEKLPILQRLQRLNDTERKCLSVRYKSQPSAHITVQELEDLCISLSELDAIERTAVMQREAKEAVSKCIDLNISVGSGNAWDKNAYHELSKLLALKVDQVLMMTEDRPLSYIDPPLARRVLRIIQAARITADVAGLYDAFDDSNGTDAMIGALDAELKTIPRSVNAWVDSIAIFQPTIELCKESLA